MTIVKQWHARCAALPSKLEQSIEPLCLHSSIAWSERLVQVLEVEDARPVFRRYSCRNRQTRFLPRHPPSVASSDDDGRWLAMQSWLPTDLETLYMAVESAAVLLILSLAWRPSRSEPTEPAVAESNCDWGPSQIVYERAIVATGKCLASAYGPLDTQSLQQINANVPLPWRDRWTGLINATGMDRVIGSWSELEGAAAYPSCYALLSWTSYDQTISNHGAMVAEQALRQLADHLNQTLSSRAVVSRYQPNRFLILRFATDLEESNQTFDALLKQLHAPEFFEARGAAIPLTFEFQLWRCRKRVDPEELIGLLEDGDPESQPHEPIESHAAESHVSLGQPMANSSLGLSESFADVGLQVAPPPAFDSLRSQLENPDVENDDVRNDDAESHDADKAEVEILGAESHEEGPVASGDSATEAAMGTVEGYASAEDIATLFASLQPNTNAATPETGSSSRPHVAEDESPDQKTRRGEPSPLEPEFRDSPAKEPRSIYAEGLEESAVENDFASLFATVRASEEGSFVHPAATDCDDTSGNETTAMESIQVELSQLQSELPTAPQTAPSHPG